MDKIYTFKQIIFGLRKEYVEVEKKLKELQKHVNVSDKVEDFRFHIAGSPCKMFLYLHKKKNLLEKLQMLLGTYIHGMTNYDLTKKIKNKYYYNKKEICSINEIEELSKKVNQIMNTDFSKNIVANNHRSIPCLENDINTLFIVPCGMGLINGVDGEYPLFDYYSCDDEIIMVNKEKKLTSDDILKVLNLSLDGKFLNDYHRKVLDNYEEKEIDIDDNFNCKGVSIEIIEEPKKLILRPKKKVD